MKKYRKFWKVLLPSVVFIFFIEITCRIFYVSITPKEGRNAVGLLIRDKNLIKSQSVQPHPYLSYVNTPKWERDGFIQNNSLGYRGKEIDLEPKPDAFRILVLGESTTLSYPYVKNPDDSWSAKLEKLLNQYGIIKTEVINGGLNYATSAELLSHYIFRDRYLKPKMVILHVGYNDVIPMLFDNYNPEYTHYRSGWSQGTVKLRPGEKFFLQFKFMQTLYAWWLKDFSLQQVLGQSTDWGQIPPAKAEFNLKSNQPEGFTRNIDLLVQNIIADGAIPVIYPINFAPKDILTSNPQIAIYIKSHFDILKAGLDKNISVLKQIALRNKVMYVEIPDNLIPVNNFIDHIHLNEGGEELKAEFISKKIKSVIF